MSKLTELGLTIEAAGEMIEKGKEIEQAVITLQEMAVFNSSYGFKVA